MPHELAILKEGPAQPVTGDEMRFEATGMMDAGWSYTWEIHDASGEDAGGLFTHESDDKKVVYYRLPDNPGIYHVRVTARKARAGVHAADLRLPVQPRPLTPGDRVPVEITGDSLADPISVNLRRADIIDTPDLPLWTVIRASTEALSFNAYLDWMDAICGSDQGAFRAALAPYVRNSLPFPDIVSYKALKLATEAFMVSRCGVRMALGDVNELIERWAPGARSLVRERFVGLTAEERDERMGLDRGDTADRLWRRFLEEVSTGDGHHIETLPYLALVRRQLPEVRIELKADAEEQVQLCYELMGERFTSPCFLELIWSYWHEEGMLVQTMNAISMRFQNRSSGPRDPLAQMALDPLRPLNNLLWGYVQDEQHRLTLARRVAEYDQEYGLTLFGRAVPRLRTADPRSRFIEAFHTLLHRASIFYKEDDDTTTIADPFPVLNALRNVHLVLAEGANNQYGDLPWTARHEMLIQQWLLARPELREFLPTRLMVVNPERWMDRVDAMKKLQAWTDTPVRYFRDLAIFGEQLLLSIRYGDWSNIVDREQAGNWARYWRQEVQWYIHAYQTVTGVDLSADVADMRQAQLPRDRFTQPAALLRQRLVEQQRRLRRGPGGAFDRRSRRGLPRGAFAFEQEAGQAYEEQPTQR
jgi:hypothetical protein